jgi:hypothetical protein
MVFKEPVYGFTDDFADYFNQIPLAPAYYWAACFSWWFGESFLGDPSLKGFLSTPPPPLTSVAEKRLASEVVSLQTLLNDYQKRLWLIFVSASM